ncbi:glycosyltransferase family 2 protein [uncultured Alistipes sp.]|uniref:glycosyltransferase family 2 protein n=1 Tax=uncultured Alistipes sp. TaxID=538949 RepID=UPI00260A6318|nr:glycosyltransferase family 2 protein [uncultured Alistipes sp.]
MNADTPILISVLVPVYGVERWIGDCARSLFSQTMWEGIEFIFVDDASPDASIEILGKALAEYPARVAQTRLLHHPENRGLAAARRTAIEAARGKWLLHADSDDIVMPSAALELLAEAEKHPEADLVFGGYFASEDPAHASTGRRLDFLPPRWSRERWLGVLLAQSHRIANRTWGLLIRRSLCTQHNIYPVEGIDFAEDYAVVPRLMHAARGIAAVRRPLYGYRAARDGSYMRRLDARAAAQYVAANRVVTDYLKGQPDYDRYRENVILGRLNIEKWILKRGLPPEEYDARLFYDGDRPRRMLHRFYAAAIESGTPLLARIAGLAANFRLR